MATQGFKRIISARERKIAKIVAEINELAPQVKEMEESDDYIYSHFANYREESFKLTRLKDSLKTQILDYFELIGNPDRAEYLHNMPAKQCLAAYSFFLLTNLKID